MSDRAGVRRTPRGDRDSGRISTFLAALMVGVMAVVGAGVDGGQALSAQKRAYSLATDAARTGAQQIDPALYRESGQAVLDPAAAQAAAADRLARTGSVGQATATTTQVTVTVWHTHPTALWSLIGIDEITVSATATAQVRHGIATPGDLP
jgi:Flp pilus assembly protein TadG